MTLPQRSRFFLFLCFFAAEPGAFRAGLGRKVKIFSISF
jgi:hypothetical protein